MKDKETSSLSQNSSFTGADTDFYGGGGGGSGEGYGA